MADATSTLHFVTEDPCCGKRLSKALLKLPEATDRWECPKCGTEWQSRKREEGMVCWYPVVVIQVWR